MRKCARSACITGVTGSMVTHYGLVICTGVDFLMKWNKKLVFSEHFACSILFIVYKSTLNFLIAIFI